MIKIAVRNDRHRFARLTSFLLALNVMAFYYYGWRALIVSALSVTVSVLTEYILCKVSGKYFDYKDTSPVVSGMLLALLMPASIPYRVIVFSSVFMASVCKFAFGGNKNLIFSPAACAYAFAALTWSNDVLRYPTPVPFGSLSLASDIPDVLDRSFTYYADISISSAGYLDIICGKLTGPMATAGILIIFICAISLYFFGDIPTPVFFSAIAVNVFLFILFPFEATGWSAVMYSLVTGSYVFILIFMVCDYRFVPKRTFAQIMYGTLYAVLSFILRKHGGFENSGAFALLIICVFVTELDRLDLWLTDKLGILGDFIAQKGESALIYIKFRMDSKKGISDAENTGEEVIDSENTQISEDNKTETESEPRKAKLKKDDK